FDDVLRALGPTLRFRVENQLTGDGQELLIELRLESFDDFEPAAIARQIPALSRLLDIRRQLSELARTARGLGNAEERLAAILRSDQKVEALLHSELGEHVVKRFRSEELPPRPSPPPPPAPTAPQGSAGGLLDQVIESSTPPGSERPSVT